MLELIDPARPGPAGLLIAGLNPYRGFDGAYRGFLGLVAGQIASSLGSVRARQADRERAEALAELDRAKTDFFSNVSHEFRTPLSLILGPAEDALAEAEDDEQRERLNVVFRNALRLQKLVNNLLEFSRIEAGSAEPMREPTDVAAFTADLASMFRVRHRPRRDRARGRAARRARDARVDREMWERIVLNLVSNAFKFTFEGEIRVTLRRDGADAVLVVADTGAGIAADDLASLFERFKRVRGVRSRTHEGSGIGLALVEELARLHGGSVQAESELGAGSAFTVRVPLEDAAPAGAATPTSGAAAYLEEALRWLPDAEASVGELAAVGAGLPAGDGDLAGRSRILIADDNADLRDYLERLLARHWDVEAVARRPRRPGGGARAPARPDPLRRDDARARRLRAAGRAARGPRHVAAAGDPALRARRGGGRGRGPRRGGRRLPAQAVLLARADRPRAGQPRSRRAAPGRRARHRAPRPAAARRATSPTPPSRSTAPGRCPRCWRSWPSAPARWSAPSGRSRSSSATASRRRTRASRAASRSPAPAAASSARCCSAASPARAGSRRSRSSPSSRLVAATRLENARLYEREHRVAETLQRSLLPESVPELDRAELAARYLPGADEASVGGDWYDAITLGEGRVVLVIGDVVGRGVKAASAMGQLRNAVRAYLLEGYGPAPTLERVNRLLDTLGGGFATISLLVVDTAGGELVYANAGHPPPLVVGPDGATHWLDAGLAPPIGAASDVAYREAQDAIPEGGALVLYTDGLVERRNEPIDAGLGRLADAASDSPGHAGDAARAGWWPRSPAARGPTTSPCWCSRAASPPASRSPCACPRSRRRSARCASGCAAGWTRRASTGPRPPTCCWPWARPPRTRSSTRSSRLPPRSSSQWRAWRGARSGSRSATTAAGTKSRRRPTAGAG